MIVAPERKTYPHVLRPVHGPSFRPLRPTLRTRVRGVKAINQTRRALLTSNGNFAAVRQP